MYTGEITDSKKETTLNVVTYAFNQIRAVKKNVGTGDYTVVFVDGSFERVSGKIGEDLMSDFTRFIRGITGIGTPGIDDKEE